MMSCQIWLALQGTNGSFHVYGKHRSIRAPRYSVPLPKGVGGVLSDAFHEQLARLNAQGVRLP